MGGFRGQVLAPPCGSLPPGPFFRAHRNHAAENILTDQNAVLPLFMIRFEIADGVGMMIGKLFEFIDALLGEVDFLCGAGIDLLFGDSILIFDKIQFTLVSAADNQYHAVPSSDQCINSNRTQFCDA